MEENDIIQATRLAGNRFRAVRDADGHVRLWYRRGKRHWIGLKLYFDKPDQTRFQFFKSRAVADRFLALTPTLGGGKGNARRKQVFADDFVGDFW